MGLLQGLQVRLENLHPRRPAVRECHPFHAPPRGTVEGVADRPVEGRHASGSPVAEMRGERLLIAALNISAVLPGPPRPSCGVLMCTLADPSLYRYKAQAGLASLGLSARSDSAFSGCIALTLKEVFDGDQDSNGRRYRPAPSRSRHPHVD